MKTQINYNLMKSKLVQLAIAILIGFLFQQCSPSVANQLEQKGEQAIPVQIAYEKIQAMVKPINSTGVVTASKEQKLSFKTGGIIDKVFVNEGEAVFEGQILATLKLDEIENMVLQAQLGLEKATRDYSRINKLYTDSVVTLEQMQNVTTALNIAKSNVKIAEYNQKYSTIIAPTSGRILMKLNEGNELVDAGTPVLVLASNEEMWQVSTGVSDKEVVDISLFDSATIEIDAYRNQIIAAHVTQIGDFPDPITGLYEVKLTLLSAALALKPGFFAHVEIISNKTKDYLTISIDAVSEGIGNTVSYYALTNNKTQAIKKTAQVEWIQSNVVVLSSAIDKTDAIVIASQKELNHLAFVEIVDSPQIQ
ncbi:MAG: efflux RND transporter periplasmic adaptor subunit [Prolixibacteraceae bacterium]|jgi:multidrug efflux system membrane fusion protein|nr:efflux RND transporter periplasmic adaptor subunit [Prolixibacteraceae bacterium]